MDALQTILIIVIVSLTLLLLLVGTQVLLIVIAARRLLTKIEQKIDGADLLTQDNVRDAIVKIKAFLRKKFLRK